MKYGDLELEFDEKLKEAEVEAVRADLPPTAPPSLPAAGQPATPSEWSRLMAVAEVSPRAAILEAWLAVEIALSRIAEARGVAPELGRQRVTPVLELVRRLEFPRELQAMIARLRELRNVAVHEPTCEVNLQAAGSYVDLTLRVLERMRRDYPELAEG